MTGPKGGDDASTSSLSLILIPGAWHGAKSWNDVGDVLSAHGRSSVAIELPSNGPDPAHLGDLEDDVEAVIAACNGIRSGVLVGHSYGATVASVAAARLDQILGIISVAGFLPDLSESATTLILRGRTPCAAEAVEVHDEGYLSVRPKKAREALYGQCPKPVAQQAISDLRLQSASSVRARVGDAGWRGVQTTYVVCENDRFLEPAFQLEHATERAAVVVRLESDHSPMLSRPHDLAQILLDVASRASQTPS